MVNRPPTRSVWVVQHVPTEGPGLFGPWLADDGIPLRILRPFAGETLPHTVTDCRGLLVMGGPMNVDETPRYPWLREEVSLLERAITARVPTVGMCLGAQLLAKTLGARVWHGPQPEVGWCDVEGTQASRQDPVFAAFPPRYTVFQWHGDAFELPKDAVHLAQSTRYPHQAFRYGENVYALQYHLEVTPAIIEAWLSHEDPLLNGVDVSRVKQHTPQYAPLLAVLARQFYSGWRTSLA